MQRKYSNFIKIGILGIILIQANISKGQSLEAFEPDSIWMEGLEKIAPVSLQFEHESTKNILVFNLFTGFQHWVIPHTSQMLKILTDKTGGFNLTMSTNIEDFKKRNLKNYDAVILNNTCSVGTKRDMFWDVLVQAMDSTKASKKALKLERNILDFVRKGGGIMAIHGGIVMQNNSAEFSEMMGGSFDYHPKQQNIKVIVEDKNNHLTSCFTDGYFNHIDEPYVFKNAYFQKDFTPLLYYNAAQIEGLRNPNGDAKRYVAWCKRYGKGFSFYVSPSHNAHSFDNPELLQFYLNGIQYVLGEAD